MVLSKAETNSRRWKNPSMYLWLKFWFHCFLNISVPGFFANNYKQIGGTPLLKYQCTEEQTTIFWNLRSVWSTMPPAWAMIGFKIFQKTLQELRVLVDLTKHQQFNWMSSWKKLWCPEKDAMCHALWSMLIHFFYFPQKGFLFFPHYFFNCWLNSYHLYMLFECCFECVLQNLLFGAGAFWYSPLCQKRFLDHAFGALLCHKWCFLVLFFLHCSLLSKHCALDCVFGALLPVQNWGFFCCPLC